MQFLRVSSLLEICCDLLCDRQYRFHRQNRVNRLSFEERHSLCPTADPPPVPRIYLRSNLDKATTASADLRIVFFGDVENFFFSVEEFLIVLLEQREHIERNEGKNLHSIVLTLMMKLRLTNFTSSQYQALWLRRLRIFIITLKKGKRVRSFEWSKRRSFTLILSLEHRPTTRAAWERFRILDIYSVLHWWHSLRRATGANWGFSPARLLAPWSDYSRENNLSLWRSLSERTPRWWPKVNQERLDFRSKDWERHRHDWRRTEDDPCVAIVRY